MVILEKRCGEGGIKVGKGMKRGEIKKGMRGKRQNRQRTDRLLSLSENKGDLSSQSFTVCTKATGDPHCVCDCLSQSDKLVCLCMPICMYVAQLGYLSIEKRWSFPWNVGCCTSRPQAKLSHRGRGESLQTCEQCGKNPKKLSVEGSTLQSSTNIKAFYVNITN